MLDRLKERIACTSFDWMPNLMWALTASPLLWWAFGCTGPIFQYPYHPPEQHNAHVFDYYLEQEGF